MWALLNTFRREIKVGLSLFIWDMVILTLIMMGLTACLKEVMHPLLPIVGTIWILATAGALWYLGDIPVDSLFLARLTGLEIGKEFTHALNIFFALDSTIVIFFSLLPVWKFWAGTILLIITLIGVVTCANLAKKEIPWAKFHAAYLWLTGIILFILATVGVAGWFKIDIFSFLTPENLSGWFNGWVARLLLFGLIFWGLSFIPKAPAKISGLLRLVGSLLIIATAVLIVFPEVQAKLTTPNNGGAGKNIVTTHHAPATAPQLPANAVFVKTLAPGERIYLTRANMDAPPPERWAKFLDGQAAKFAPWPSSARHRYAENTINENHDLYVVLPPRQNISVSAIDPALKMAQTSTASDCLLDKHFGRTTAEQEMAKDFQEGSFSNK